MQIQDKPQIISALSEKVDAFNNYISLLNKEQFEAAPNGKWSAGQNLDHLIRSIKPLQLAYGLPKFALNILFGKTNRPSRTYELIEKYTEQKQRLISKIEKQSEIHLDKYILPHPLLGKLTLREMLYFTIHHNEHHLELLKSRNAYS
jgi:hypothetical protein